MVLIRIVVLLFLSVSICNAQQPKYKVIWEDGLPIGIATIFSDDFLFSKETLGVRLSDSDKRMLGEVQATDSSVIFTPVIPFSFGLEYKVYSDKDYLYSFTINSTQNAPSVMAIYPKGDTIPENFLKLNLVFDQPMGEGKANEYVQLLHNGTVVENAFLLLQPELWNEDHTILTLWLEPGRIKRDLGPNQRLGEILEEGNTYEVAVDKRFKNKSEQSLIDNFSKPYYVGKRDEQQPNINRWRISSPKEPKGTLIISFDEPAALEVAINAIKIKKGDEEIDGLFSIINDQQLSFQPSKPWLEGDYSLIVESRFEDLAGNNLNRLFDEDLTKARVMAEKKLHFLEFRVLF